MFLSYSSILTKVESTWVVTSVSKVYQLHGNINLGSIKDFMELSGVL